MQQQGESGQTSAERRLQILGEVGLNQVALGLNPPPFGPALSDMARVYLVYLVLSCALISVYVPPVVQLPASTGTAAIPRMLAVRHNTHRHSSKALNGCGVIHLNGCMTD
jgi:hypothetical protein